jgi:hypothetical protein
MVQRRLQLAATTAAILILVLALPAAGEPGPDRIAAGFDFWQTLGSGATKYSFARDPLPADFFCLGSAAFAGEISFEGVPLRTAPQGVLGTTDTIIERLDDAVFDAGGVARTRIQGRALNLRGAVIQNSCGSWRVGAGLTGFQPITEMVLRRLDEHGGVFDADLSLRVRITFTHEATREVRSVSRVVKLPTARETPFAMGAAAFACAQPTPLAARVERIRLLGGERIRTVALDPQRLDLGDRFATTSAATAIATGCLCRTNADGTTQCLPVYSWHNPCRKTPPYTLPPNPGYDCELHFTHTPCQLGYESQCTADEVESSYLEQLEELKKLGYIEQSPSTVLDAQLGRRPAAERPRN